MLFGVQEEKDKDLEKTVLEICEQLNEKPRVTECSRVGTVKQGTVRPIKVALRSADIVNRILSKARQLRTTDDYKNVYLSVDRTPEERSALKQLVGKLKQMRENQPDQHHYLRKNEICSRNKWSVNELWQLQETVISIAKF